MAEGGAGWQLLAEQVSAVLKDPPAVTLSQQQLCDYNGTYSDGGNHRDDPLRARRLRGRTHRAAIGQVPGGGADVFFVAGQPRTRRIFLRDAQGKVVGFVDRREGEDVRWNKTS